MYNVSLGEFGEDRGGMIGMGSSGNSSSGGASGMASSIVGGVTNLVGGIAGAVGAIKSAKEGTKQAQTNLEIAKLQYASQVLTMKQEAQLRMMELASPKKKGLPGWAWALIALGGVGVVGGAGLYFYSKQ